MDSELEAYAKASETIARGYFRAEKIMLGRGEYYTAAAYRDEGNERKRQAAWYRKEDADT